MSDESGEVALVNPQGALVTVAAHQEAAALAQGYSAPSPEQQALAETKSKYGEGLANTALAAGAGAARGLSFGFSDQALTAGGVDPAALSALKEQHGVASTVGEVAGVGAGLLATGGLGGAAGAGVRTVARLGELAAEGAEAGLAATRIGQAGAGLAQRVLAKGLAKGAGSAVEGAFYGAGQAISEDALGDPEALGQGFLAHVGLGAVFGGLGGGTIGALGEVAATGTRGIASLLGRKGTVNVTQEAAAVSDALGSVAAEEPGGVTRGLAKAAHVASGGDEGVLQEILSPGERGVAARAAAFGENDVEDVTLRGFTEHINRIEDDARDVMDKARGGFKTDQVSRVIRKDNVPEQWAAANEFLDRGQALVNKFRSEKNIYGDTPGLGKLEKYLDGYRGRINKALGSEGDQSTEIFQAMDDLKRKIGPLAKPGKFPNAHEVETVGAIRELYSRDLRPLLEKQDVWGGAGEMQRRINEKWTQLLENHGLFRKQFLTEVGRAGDDMWEARYAAEPAAVEGYLKQLGRARNDLKEQLVSSHIDRIQDFAREMRQVFETDPVTAARIANIEQTHGSLTGEIKAMTRRMGLRNEAKKILGTKTGRALAQFAALEQTLRSRIKGTPLEGILRQEMRASGGRPEVAAARAATGSVPSSNIPLAGPPTVAERAMGSSRAAIAPAAATAGHGLAMTPGERKRAKDRALSTYLRRSIITAAAGQQQVARLAGIEKANIAVNKAIDADIKDFADNIGKRKGGAAASVGAAQRLHLSANRKGSKAGQAYNDRLDELVELTQNPQAMLERMTKNLQGLDHAAPRITGELQLTAVRAVNFLYEKAPKDPLGAGMLNPAASKWHPSTTEMAQFERYMTAVQQPLTVLQDLKQGTISNEGVEALRVVYPALYGNIVAGLLPKLAELRDIPFQTRMQLSTAFQMPVDTMARPDFFASMQQMHQAAMVSAGPPKPSPNSKNARATITATPLQRAVGG